MCSCHSCHAHHFPFWTHVNVKVLIPFWVHSCIRLLIGESIINIFLSFLHLRFFQQEATTNLLMCEHIGSQIILKPFKQVVAAPQVLAWNVCPIAGHLDLSWISFFSFFLFQGRKEVICCGYSQVDFRDARDSSFEISSNQGPRAARISVVSRRV